MHYTERVPCARLHALVNCYWMLESPMPVTLHDRTFPDGCQEIVFNVNSVVKRCDNGKEYFSNPEVELIGQMTTPYDIITQGQQTYFGVKFYPHSFAAFTDESVYDLRDQSIDMHALFSRDFSKVSASVFEMPDFEHFVREMDSFLLSQIREEKIKSRAYRIVDQSVATLFARIPELQINSLHQISGVSKRYLQTSFRDFVGLSPKQLFKMIRFQSCFQKLHMSCSLTDVALQCGYYDHAHFTRDFREYSGTTPSQYRQMDMPLNRFFLDASNRAWLCNYTN